MYYDHYIRAFRANKGDTPAASNYASRPSFDTMADMMNDTLETAPQSHATAKRNALIRDGHRCIVTGIYDHRSVKSIRELHDHCVLGGPSVILGGTQCAHIFPESADSDIDPQSNKREYAATKWAVIARFGHESLPDDLNGPKVHRLENVMTMEPNVHLLFDQLQIWFVATNEENKYKLEAIDSMLLNGRPKYVTFKTPDPVKFSVPSPTYLAIHAACAKVAHLSGAAKCIDKFYRDMEDGATLDPGGASANLLEEAIRGLQVSGYEVNA